MIRDVSVALRALARSIVGGLGVAADESAATMIFVPPPCRGCQIVGRTPASTTRGRGHAFGRRHFPCALALGVLLALAPAVAVHAQLPKIFVASFGNDSNDGSRGSPKRNFQAAHDAVAAGGDIVVLDTAGYGMLSISKSVSVIVPPGVNGFVTVSTGGNGITVNAAATDVVALRGLIVEGPGNSRGILVNTVGRVTIEDCTVRNFDFGIVLAPTSALNAVLHNCTVRDCTDGLTTDPSNATPNSIFGTIVALGCSFRQNTSLGFQLANSGASYFQDAYLENCVVAEQTNGTALQTSSNGGTARMFVSNCTVTGNSVGVSATGFSNINSRTNNTLEGNNGGNVFANTYSAK